MNNNKDITNKDKEILKNHYRYNVNDQKYYVTGDENDPRTLTKSNFLSRFKNASDEDIAFIMHASTE